MDDVVTQGLFKITEQGVVATLLVLVIVALIWDRSRILKAHKEMTDKFIQAIQTNGESHAAVVRENTKAFIELNTTVRELRK